MRKFIFFYITFFLIGFADPVSAQSETCYEQRNDPSKPACSQNATNTVGVHFPTEQQRSDQWTNPGNQNGWDFYWDATQTDSAFFTGTYGQEPGDNNNENLVPYHLWFDNPHDDDLDDDLANSGACKFHFLESEGMVIDRIKDLDGNLCPVRPYRAIDAGGFDRGMPITGRYNTGALTRRDTLMKEAATQGVTFEFGLKLKDHNLGNGYQSFFKKYESGSLVFHKSPPNYMIQQDAVTAYFNGPVPETSMAVYISPKKPGSPSNELGCIKLYKQDLLTPNKRGCQDVVLDLLKPGFHAENAATDDENPTLFILKESSGDYFLRYKIMLQNLSNAPIYDVKLFTGDGQMILKCGGDAPTGSISHLKFTNESAQEIDEVPHGRICAKLPPSSHGDVGNIRSEYDLEVKISDLDILSERVSTFVYATYRTSPNGPEERVEMTKVTTILKTHSIGADGVPVARYHRKRISAPVQAYEPCDSVATNDRPYCDPQIAVNQGVQFDLPANIYFCVQDPDLIDLNPGFKCPNRGYVPTAAANHDWIAIKDIDTTVFNTYRVTVDPNTKIAKLYVDGVERIANKVANSTFYATTYAPGEIEYLAQPPGGDSQYEFPTFVIGDNAANVEYDVDGWPDLQTNEDIFDKVNFDPEKPRDSTDIAAVNLHLTGTTGGAAKRYHPGNLDISGAYTLSHFAYALGIHPDANAPQQTGRTIPDLPFIVPMERGLAGIEFDPDDSWVSVCTGDFPIFRAVGQEFEGLQTTEPRCEAEPFSNDDLIVSYLSLGNSENEINNVEVTPNGHLRIRKNEKGGKMYIKTLPRYQVRPAVQPADDYCNGHLCGSGHWSIEFRAKFLGDDDPDVQLDTNSHTSEDAFAIKVLDHIGTYWFILDTNSIKAGLGGKYVGRTHELTMDTTDRFHTYRIVRKQNDPFVYLFIDGEERAAIADFKMTTVQRNAIKLRSQDIGLTVGDAQQIIPDSWLEYDNATPFLYQRPDYKNKEDKKLQYSVEIDYIRWSDQDVMTLGDDEELDEAISTQRITLNDVVAPMSGTNIYNGFAGNDRIRADSGENYLYGGHGNDRLYAYQGQDYVYGGPGLDNIYAGNYGESDADIIVLDIHDSSYDLIRNFEPQWDSITVRGVPDTNVGGLVVSSNGTDSLVEYEGKLLAKVLGLANHEALQYNTQP